MRGEMVDISRRDFAVQAAAGALAAPLLLGPVLRSEAVAAAAASLTAQQVVDRIRQHIGVEWTGDDVDTFKAGDPATVVTGVVTTSMATLDVLQKAVQAGANLNNTAAPTFYTRADVRVPGGRGTGAGPATGRGGPPRGGGPATAPPSPASVSGPGTGASAPMPPAPALPRSVVPPATPGPSVTPDAVAPDPVYAGKNAFIDTHQLVVFRLAQHWNQRTPDPRAQGLATAMGFRLRQESAGPANGAGLYSDITPTSLEALASQLKKALGTRGGIRGIGDRTLVVRRIGFLPGYTLIQAAIAMLPHVDAIVAGEVQEWESATYAQDVAFAGIKKGFLSIGRVVNEAPGMQMCAGWLKTIVPEVPVRFISAGDPYWRPA